MKKKDQTTTLYDRQPDETLFQQACDTIIGRQWGLHGIGTLSEKTVHAVLKYYYAPNENYHEIKIGSYVADICKEGEIYEIQTRSFNTMRAKLSAFLTDYEVTIVYPVALTKYVRWIDPSTGEISVPRKSPKKGRIYDILPELYKIKSFLSNEHLHFEICFIEMEEYKILDGWSKDKKKGATKTDRIPKSICGLVTLYEPEDYYKFLMKNSDGKLQHLPPTFTSKDIALLLSVNLKQAQLILHLLTYLELLQPIGKQGRLHLYQLPALRKSQQV